MQSRKIEDRIKELVAGGSGGYTVQPEDALEALRLAYKILDKTHGTSDPGLRKTVMVQAAVLQWVLGINDDEMRDVLVDLREVYEKEVTLRN